VLKKDINVITARSILEKNNRHKKGTWRGKNGCMDPAYLLRSPQRKHRRKMKQDRRKREAQKKAIEEKLDEEPERQNYEMYQPDVDGKKFSQKLCWKEKGLEYILNHPSAFSMPRASEDGVIGLIGSAYHLFSGLVMPSEKKIRGLAPDAEKFSQDAKGIKTAVIDPDVTVAQVIESVRSAVGLTGLRGDKLEGAKKTPRRNKSSAPGNKRRNQGATGNNKRATAP